jgi:uncharacterized membrane protein HdeD (DUF308 family)
MTNSEFPDFRAAGALLGRNWGWILVRGIITLVFGILAVFYPLGAVFAFTALFAAYAMASGILEIIAGVKGARHSKDRWGMLIFSGILGVAVGVVFLLWPGASTTAYAFVAICMLAAWAIGTGLFQLLAAIRLRKVIEGEFWLGLLGVLSIALGGWMLYTLVVSPATSMIALGWMIGWFAIIAGVIQILLSFRLKGLGERMRD